MKEQLASSVCLSSNDHGSSLSGAIGSAQGWLCRRPFSGMARRVKPGLLSPAVAIVSVSEHAQFGICVWNMRALLVCDEGWTGAYLGATACSKFDPRDFIFLLGAINRLVHGKWGKWAQHS